MSSVALHFILTYRYVLSISDMTCVADVHAALASPLVRPHLKANNLLSFNNLLLSELPFVLLRELSTVSSPLPPVLLSTSPHCRETHLYLVVCIVTSFSSSDVIQQLSDVIQPYHAPLPQLI